MIRDFNSIQAQVHHRFILQCKIMDLLNMSTLEVLVRKMAWDVKSILLLRKSPKPRELKEHLCLIMINAMEDHGKHQHLIWLLRAWLDLMEEKQVRDSTINSQFIDQEDMDHQMFRTIYLKFTHNKQHQVVLDRREIVVLLIKQVLGMLHFRNSLTLKNYQEL